MLNILGITSLKCQNLRKLEGKEKYKNCFKPVHHGGRYPIIGNIFLSYSLVEHYFSPYLKNKFKT